MINDKEKKMIQRYCIYPKIAVVALIFSFVQCAMQVAGAVSTVSTSIDMLSEAGSNAENMAHAYRIPIPDIKKQLIAFAVIPILIVVGTYIPQYIKGKQAMDQRIAASAKQVEIVKKALEPVHIKINTKGDVRMKAHEYWSVGALITMLGTFYSGYKGSKSSHKYFAASSLLCMIMAIYTGHKMISKNKKTKKEPISLGNEE